MVVDRLEIGTVRLELRAEPRRRGRRDQVVR